MPAMRLDSHESKSEVVPKLVSAGTTIHDPDGALWAGNGSRGSGNTRDRGCC